MISHARTSAECAGLRGFMAVASTRNPGSEVPATPVVKGNFLRPLYLVPHRLTAAERHRRISDLAYRRAEQRGFAPGNEAEDWLEAEREVDAGRY
jgi:hypothetical protein